MTDPKLDTADANADAARQQLVGTAQELRDRLKPSALIEDGRQAIADRAVAVIDDTRKTAARHPGILIGGAAVIGAGAVLLASRLVRRTPKAVGSGVAKTGRRITATQIANGLVFAARIAAEIRKAQAKRGPKS